MVAAGNDCRADLIEGANTFHPFREDTYAGFRRAMRSLDGFLVRGGCLAPSLDLDRHTDQLGSPPRRRIGT